MAKKATQKVAKAPKTKAPKAEKTKRKQKKDKDPNAPKRGCSGYIFFSNSRREAVKKENPNIDHKQIIAVISKEWNALSDKDKAPFNKQAEADKARYLKEKAAYKPKK